MSYSLDQSLLALTPSKAPKEPRAAANRSAVGRTPFELPQEPSDRAAAARTRAGERRASSPRPEAARHEDARPADPPRRTDSSRRAERPDTARPERADRRVEDRPGWTERSRQAEDRVPAEARDKIGTSEDAVERADATDASSAPADTLAAAVAPPAAEPLPAHPETVAAEGTEETASAVEADVPTPQQAPLPPTAEEATGPVETDAATPDSNSGIATALAASGSAPRLASEPAGEAPQDGRSQWGRVQPGQNQPMAAAEELADGSPEQADPALPEKREAFADHLKAEGEAGRTSGSVAAKLVELTGSDQEQSSPASTSLQAGPGLKPGHAAPAAPQQAPVTHQVPWGAVPIEIGMKALAGVNRFEIRLDPAELGRIDVRLDIGEGGEVKAHLVVDRVETLALLQRDAKTLERAFEQAGLKPSEGGVDLSLRDPSGDGRFQERQDRDERGRTEMKPGRNEESDMERAERQGPQAKPLRWRGAAGVDLRI